MSAMTAQNKLDSMKKTGKILRIVTLITSIVASLLLILFLLMPVTNLQLGGAGKYIEGYNYYGWQLAIFGCGYPPVPILAMFEDAGSLAGDYVPTTHDFDTNILLILGIVLPILAFIVGGSSPSGSKTEARPSANSWRRRACSWARFCF